MSVSSRPLRSIWQILDKLGLPSETLSRNKQIKERKADIKQIKYGKDGSLGRGKLEEYTNMIKIHSMIENNWVPCLHSCLCSMCMPVSHIHS